MNNAHAEPFEDEGGEPAVRGFLHAAVGRDALVLTHGASGNAGGPLLVALAETFAAAGIAVLRVDLPFRQARRQGPPSPSAADRDQAGIGRAVGLLRQRYPGRVFAGGQSYGGRQATMVAASQVPTIDGLLVLSYPLHPPGQPTRLRTAHLRNLTVPALFVSGDRDPFGAIEELQAAIELIPARAELLTVPGAGHSLLTKANKATLGATIVERFQRLVGE